MDNNKTKKFTGKVLSGKVASAHMDKTVIVEVTHLARHPLYKKTIRKSRRFAAHNELPDLKVGDQVRIEETRPISKNKHFRVAEKLS
jgi:small subunit ribosomal protein S17